MEALELQRGFRLGAWLIEPRKCRVSCGGVESIVPEEHMQVLLCLVESRGEFVDRHTLAQRAYGSKPGSGQDLRQAITAWHAVFGDSPRHPRFIAPVGQDGYVLIAHFKPIQRTPAPERLVAAGLRDTSSPGTRRTAVGYANHLLMELRRRSVFHVAGSYLVGMWILLQVAEVTLAPLHLPAWWSTALTILAVVGLPIVIAVAWSYEITSDGLVRDSKDASAAIPFTRMRRAVAPAIIAGVVLMAAVTGYAWWESIR